MDENKEFTLYGRPIDKHKVPVLVSAVLGIFSCILVSFWSEFLISESEVCDQNMDCFVFNSTIETDPLSFENCTSYQEQDEEHNIRCYFFSFNYIDAIGNSGIVLVVGAFILTSQVGLLAGLLTLKDKFHGFTRAATIIFLVVTVLFTFFLMLLILSLLILPEWNNHVTRTNNSVVQFTAYYVALS